MTTATQVHSPHFRREIAEPFFKLIQSGESCVVAGIAGLGKSRLLQFLLQKETLANYLGDDTQLTLLVWADCNRMAELSPWGLYELLLTTLLERASDHEEMRPLCEQLIPLRSESIIERNSLLAQRNLELAIRMLCSKHEVKFAFILDEFDACYRTLAPQVLANLLAIRDANKYRLCYALFMREHPQTLRNPDECEGFYELLSRSVLYLRPYVEADAREAIELISHRRQIPLDESGVDALLYLSGGHPGLIVGLMASYFHSAPSCEADPVLDLAESKKPNSIALGDNALSDAWLEWAENSSEAQEECRKIWEGLGADEKRSLHHIALGTSISMKEKDSITKKGLLLWPADAATKTKERFFSPLFQQYVLNHASMDGPTLRVDKASGTVWVNGKPSPELTDKEYDLAVLLADNLNQLCSTDQIITKIWPGDEGYEISSNAVAALVRRLRKKIEPNPSHPQYLLSIKGRGYRLTNSGNS